MSVKGFKHRFQISNTVLWVEILPDTGRA